MKSTECTRCAMIKTSKLRVYIPEIGYIAAGKYTILSLVYKLSYLYLYKPHKYLYIAIKIIK